MAKKVKGLKKVKKFGIGKFLVMALVLGGGLIYGTQMVQKNQENRSNAAAPKQTCKCSNSKYGTAYACAKGKGTWKCELSVASIKPTATPVKKSSGKKYYFYNGSKCILTGDSYTTPTLCKNNVRSACYGSLKDCESAHPTPTPTPLVCSSSSCIGCTSASNCNSVGCFWETAMKVCANSLSSCGSSPNTCKKGKVNSIENSRYYYIWKCGNDECRLEKSDALDVDTDSNCSADRLYEQFCKDDTIYECRQHYINKYTWVKTGDCNYGCKNKLSLNNRTAECKECKTGDQYCNNGNLKVCRDGSWKEVTCSLGCDYRKSLCRQCKPNDRKCGSKEVNTSVIDVCDENGFWEVVEECPNGCADTYCI